jgi:hypothetical protein
MPRYEPEHRSRLEAQEKSLLESGDFDRRLDNAILDENQRELDAIAAKESPVAPGLDRTGMPELRGVGGLAELEQQTRHRLSPRRNRWADVAKFDERAAEFDARRTEVVSRLTPFAARAGQRGEYRRSAPLGLALMARRVLGLRACDLLLRRRSQNFSASPTR